MKNILKKSALWWLLWLAVIVTINFVKAEEIVLTINPALINDYLQKVRLHTLFLWSWEEARLDVDNGKLKIWSGLVVWNGANVSSDNSTYVVIGWGTNNSINGDSNFAGIGWGSNNKVWYDSTVIGWWTTNVATWENATIVGWKSNKAQAWGVVVGWNSNQAFQWWVVIGWSNNKAYKNSLALWTNSQWNEGGFIWDVANTAYTVNGESARIHGASSTNNSVLIGTYTKRAQVNLVVGGGVKVEWREPLTNTPDRWEIRSINGCIYANDGQGWHVITRSDPDNGCSDVSWMSKPCEFGNTKVWDWDIITGYQYSYVPTKTSAWTKVTACTAQKLVCSDGHLYVKKAGNTNYQPDLTKNADKYYPYCYKMN